MQYDGAVVIFSNAGLFFFYYLTRIQNTQGQVIGIPETDRRSYSDCYQYELLSSCDDDQTILVDGLYYGTKIDDGTCSLIYIDADPANCCQLEDDDCTWGPESRYFYERCSGLQRCNSDVTIPNELNLGKCNVTYMIVTQYLHMDFFCVPIERIGSMCDTISTSKVDGQPYYLQNRGYPNTISSADTSCACSVESDACDTTISVYVIHLELTSSSGSCDQSIIINSTDDEIRFQCNDNNNYTLSSRAINGSYITVVFENSAVSNGGKFWIGFHAEDRLFIECPPISQQYCLPVITESTEATTPTMSTTTITQTTSTTNITPTTPTTHTIPITSSTTRTKSNTTTIVTTSSITTPTTSTSTTTPTTSTTTTTPMTSTTTTTPLTSRTTTTPTTSSTTTTPTTYTTTTTPTTYTTTTTPTTSTATTTPTTSTTTTTPMMSSTTTTPTTSTTATTPTISTTTKTPTTSTTTTTPTTSSTTTTPTTSTTTTTPTTSSTTTTPTTSTTTTTPTTTTTSTTTTIPTTSTTTTTPTTSTTTTTPTTSTTTTTPTISTTTTTPTTSTTTTTPTTSTTTTTPTTSTTTTTPTLSTTTTSTTSTTTTSRTTSTTTTTRTTSTTTTSPTTSTTTTTPTSSTTSLTPTISLTTRSITANISVPASLQSTSNSESTVNGYIVAGIYASILVVFIAIIIPVVCCCFRPKIKGTVKPSIHMPDKTTTSVNGPDQEDISSFEERELRNSGQTYETRSMHADKDGLNVPRSNRKFRIIDKKSDSGVQKTSNNTNEEGKTVVNGIYHGKHRYKRIKYYKKKESKSLTMSEQTPSEYELSQLYSKEGKWRAKYKPDNSEKGVTNHKDYTDAESQSFVSESNSNTRGKSDGLCDLSNVVEPHKTLDITSVPDDVEELSNVYPSTFEVSSPETSIDPPSDDNIGRDALKINHIWIGYDQEDISKSIRDNIRSSEV